MHLLVLRFLCSLLAKEDKVGRRKNANVNIEEDV
jgi:hypothetical protein